MSNRYQTVNYTTASVSAGANVDTNTASLPSLFNIVKIKVTQDAPGGTFDFKISKKDTFLTADLLYFADDVTPALYYPMDNSSGSPVEAEEGPPIPYDDEDGTGELHIRITNNDGVAHTYTVTILYEEVPVMSSAGAATFRSNVIAAALILGTNPASVGLIRLPSGLAGIEIRDSGNTRDDVVFGANATDVTLHGGVNVTVVNDGIRALASDNSTFGFMVITSAEDGAAGLFMFRRTSNAVSIISDVVAVFSTTATTAGKINVYYSAGNARYEIENKTGGSRTFKMILLGNTN